MIAIQRPTKQLMDLKTNEVRLWFDKDLSVAPDGRYRMMGGMFFPSSVPTEAGRNTIRGYALMAGRHEATKVTYIFEERNWLTVEHILDQATGAIINEGLSSWLNMIWSNYFAQMFSFRQDDETLFRYNIDIARCAMILPKPAFIDAEWNDDMQPVSVVNRELLLGRLKMRRNSILISELDQFRADEEPDAKKYPAVHALHCLMTNLDRYWA